MSTILTRFMGMAAGLVLAVSCFAAEENCDQCETGIVSTAISQSGSGIMFRANTRVANTPLPVGEPKFNIWRSIGAMLLVIGLLLAANSYVARKRGMIMSMRNKDRRVVIVERTVVDHKRSLLLVEADGQRILVGLAPDRMETIAVLSGVAPAVVASESAPASGTGKDVSFAESLRILMGKDSQ